MSLLCFEHVIGGGQAGESNHKQTHVAMATNSRSPQHMHSIETYLLHPDKTARKQLWKGANELKEKLGRIQLDSD